VGDGKDEGLNYGFKAVFKNSNLNKQILYLDHPHI